MPSTAELSDAVAQLAADRLVAFPTETVWGLGAVARSDAALEALRAFKGRSESQPISVLVSGSADLVEFGFETSVAGERLIRALWPGPITLVLRCDPSCFARGVAREGDGAVGVRCSSHPVAAALVFAAIQAGLGPLTATSLNRSGEAAVTSRVQALELCGAAIERPTVLPAGESDDSAGRPSTVVDLTGSRPRILRPGAVARLEIERIAGVVLEPETEAKGEETA